jgi:cyanophycinase
MSVFPSALRFAIATLTCVVVVFAPASRAQPVARGIAVPIGGALKYDNDEVWSRLVDLAGGKGARYAVFATAAGDPEKSAASIIDALNRHGAVAEHIPVAPKLAGSDYKSAARDPALIAKVRASRGIYFAGGAQERIVDAMFGADGKPTPMLDAIREVFDRGGVVAGSSAGAAIMSTTMFRDPPDNLSILKFGLKDGRDVDRGLGFIEGVFVDQHFLKRGRIGRMLPLMVKSGYKLGLGVDENTAAIVHGDEVEVIGFKGVLLADLADATSDKGRTEFNLRSAKLSYLDRGDRYNLRTRTLTPSKEKRDGKTLDPADAKYSPYYSSDMFYPDVLGDSVAVHLMANLIDNKQKEVTGLAFNISARDAKADLGFEFKFRKGPGSIGYFSPARGGEDYTVANIYLDIEPVTLAKPLYRPYRVPVSRAN